MSNCLHTAAQKGSSASRQSSDSAITKVMALLRLSEGHGSMGVEIGGGGHVPPVEKSAGTSPHNWCFSVLFLDTYLINKICIFQHLQNTEIPVHKIPVHTGT